MKDCYNNSMEPGRMIGKAKKEQHMYCSNGENVKDMPSLKRGKRIACKLSTR